MAEEYGPIIGNLTEDACVRIFQFVCEDDPSAFTPLPQVSKRWRNVLMKRRILLQDFLDNPDNFEDLNSFVASNDDATVHIHCSRRDTTLAQQGLAHLIRTAGISHCLKIWVGSNTIDFLSLVNPRLQQLVLWWPPNGNTAWIPKTSKFPQLCSLHLDNPPPQVLIDLSTDVELPPLVELCITIPSFPNQGGSAMITSIYNILGRLGKTLETLTLKWGPLPPGINNVFRLELPCLKQLSLFVEDKEQVPFPFDLTTPKLEILADNHISYSGLYHTKQLATLTTLVDWRLIPSFECYNQLANVKIISIRLEGKAKLNQLLLSTQFCPSLTYVLVRTNAAMPSEIWARNELPSVTIQHYRRADWAKLWSRIFELHPWTCNGCCVDHGFIPF